MLNSQIKTNSSLPCRADMRTIERERDNRTTFDLKFNFCKQIIFNLACFVAKTTKVRRTASSNLFCSSKINFDSADKMICRDCPRVARMCVGQSKYIDFWNDNWPAFILNRSTVNGVVMAMLWMDSNADTFQWEQRAHVVARYIYFPILFHESKRETERGREKRNVKNNIPQAK